MEDGKVEKGKTIDTEKYPYHIRDVHISDPCILADAASGHYFTYVQFADTKRFADMKQKKGRFYVLESEDLIHWTKPEVCFVKGDFWADLDYWAPEVHVWRGRYCLISSFRAKGTYRRCQCLVADSPRGPFAPVAPEPVTPEGWQCLDGTLYADKDGKPWMVFCHEWLQVNDGQICAIPLSEDLGRAVGEPVILFRASDGPWTGDYMNGGYVTDGPFLHRMKNGTLIMLWSGFSKQNAYTIGYARSKSGDILGPWEQEAEPLYAMDGAHAMLFYTFSGQLMMACHAPNAHPKKRILLFEMEEKGDRLHIINEVTGNWYQAIGGIAQGFAYRERCIEEPCFTKSVRQEIKE